MRFPSAFQVRDWNLYLRGLLALADSSTQAFFSSENAVGEQGTFLASLGAGLGRDGEELKGQVDFSATVAYRHAW